MMPVCENYASWFLAGCRLVFSAMILFLSVEVHAHEIRPGIVDFRASRDGKFELQIKFNMESWLAKIAPEHSNTADSPNAEKYDALRNMSAEDLLKLFERSVGEFSSKFELKFDGVSFSPNYLGANIPAVGDSALERDSIARFGGNIPARTTNVSWKYALSASVFRVEDAVKTSKSIGDETGRPRRVSQYIRPGATSDQFAISAPVMRGAFVNFLDYIALGFTHIVPKGLDHILFVVGLFLLSTQLSPLIWQITSFTIAHSVTLGFGMAGVISMPGNIVEPLIAASIVYVSVENIFTNRLNAWRPVVVFLFGLLHGLGFAGVLNEIGLDGSNFFTGLAGFNVGVELGQLAVIAACFLLVGIWFGNKKWYHQRVTIPGSAIIAMIGAWWFYQRIFLV